MLAEAHPIGVRGQEPLAWRLFLQRVVRALVVPCQPVKGPAARAPLPRLDPEDAKAPARQAARQPGRDMSRSARSGGEQEEHLGLREIDLLARGVAPRAPLLEYASECFRLI